MSIDQFLENAITFGLYPPNGGGGSGSYQQRGSSLTLSLFSSDYTLTNPMPSVIVVNGQPDSSRSIHLPLVNEANSPQIGDQSYIFINLSEVSFSLRNNAGTLVTAVPAYGYCRVILQAKIDATNGNWLVSLPAQTSNNLYDLTDFFIARQALQLWKEYQTADCSTSDWQYPNPAPSYVKITNSNDFGLFKIILSPANTSISVLVGDTLRIKNNTSNNVDLYLNDGTTFLITLNALTFYEITLTANNTGNGTWEVDSFAQGVVPMYQGGTGSSNLSGAQTNLQITGVQNTPIWFVPPNVSPAAANQIAFGNGANYPYCQFVQSGLSYAECSIPMPYRWNLQPFTLQFEWYTSLTTGTVVWNIDAAIVNDGDSLNPSFGTAITVNSTANVSANTKKVVATAVITPSGTPAANARLNIRIYRNGGSGSDNLAGNAFLLNPVILKWIASIGNDGVSLT